SSARTSRRRRPTPAGRSRGRSPASRIPRAAYTDPRALRRGPGRAYSPALRAYGNRPRSRISPLVLPGELPAALGERAASRAGRVKASGASYARGETRVVQKEAARRNDYTTARRERMSRITAP